jgi:hypothetical protein
MKRALLLAVPVLTMVVVGLAPATASAQRESWDFETVNKNVCSPLPSCALPQRGTITCPGAGVEALPGLMPPWCPAGSRTMVRDRMLTFGVVSTNDERVRGGITMKFNMNLDTDTFSGHIWGTYLLEVPGRGSWEGMFEGRVNSASMWTYRVVAFGTGEFVGLQLRADGLWKAGQGDRLSGQIQSTY